MTVLFTAFDGLYADDGTRLAAHENLRGLTWDRERVYLAQANAVLVLDPALRPERRLEGDLHEVHQILWRDGVLYVCNTGRNRVEMWDGSRWTSKAWNQTDCDADHVNSIWFGAGGAWVVEFRHRGPGQPSRLRRCDGDLETLELVPVGPPVHNVYVEGGVRYLLSSHDGGFLVNGLAVPFIEGPHFLRGLARTPGRWHVGLTHYEPDRASRKGDAGLLELDDDLREVRRLNVPDAGPVYSVRATEGDAAHNGLPFPGGAFCSGRAFPGRPG